MNIEHIITEKRCMRCGMCSSICPVDAVNLIYSDKMGLYNPIVDKEKCVDCGKCIISCPAENATKKTGLIGEYKKIYLAHAKDKTVRFSATSGGVVNALVRYLIENEIFDAVLMTSYSVKSPIKTQALLIDKENVLSLTSNPRDYASRYVSVPVLCELKKSIIKRKKIAVVGTPCQVKALNLNSNTKDFFKIGITCSGAMSYKATDQYMKKQNLPDAKMYYRGEGWPGKNTLKYEDKTIEYPHLGSLFERMFSSQIFKNPGCRNCHDHFAEEADISFCDFWNKQERKNETIGNSCVIVRSDRATNIIEKMIHDGYIDVVRELNEKETVNTQMSVLKFKKGNLSTKFTYRVFNRIIDLIFKLRIYRFFNLKIYKLFCTIYSKLCRSAQIPE